MAEPTRFDIYCQREDRWGWAATHDGGDEDSAFAEAEALDADPEVRGVRIMAVTEYGGGRTLLETLAWISPHLSKVTPPGQLRRNRARRAVAEAEQPTTPTAPAQPVITAETFRAPAEGILSPPPPIAPGRERPPRSRVDPLRKVVRFAGIAVVCAIAAAFGVQFIDMFLGALERSGLSLSGGAAGFLTFMLGACFFVIAGMVMLKQWPDSWTVVERNTGKKTSLDGLPNKFQSDAASPTSAPMTPEPSAATKDHNRRMLLFLADMLSALTDALPRLDDAVTLGLKLLIAGAAEQLGNQENLSNIDKLKLLRASLDAMGARPERIDSFCREYADYRRDELYKDMIGAGGEAMRVHAIGGANAFHNLDERLKDWVETVIARDRAGGTLVVMALDATMVADELTSLPTTLKAMIESAVAGNEGRIAPSASDHLIAAFPSGPDAINAATTIQRQLISHSAETNNIRVELKIGLDSGDAGAGDDALAEGEIIATIVERAARICDEAYTGAIFISTEVRDLCPGRNIPFALVGDRAIPDDDSMTTLYRVDWQSGSTLTTTG